MNTSETTRLCKAIAALAPAQKFDDETPAIWAVVLGGVRYEDAREAIIKLAADHAFMAPTDIIAEVKRIRADRLANTDPTTITPNVDPDKPGLWRQELAAIRDAIADGRFDVDGYVSSGLALSGVPARRAVGDGRKPPELEGRISLSLERLDRVVRRPEPPLPGSGASPPREGVSPSSSAPE